MSRPDRAEFFEALNAKLDRGERQYGEASFERPAPSLVTELEAEALDLAGWGYILWVRLRSLRAATEAAERRSLHRAAADNAPSPKVGAATRKLLEDLATDIDREAR